MLVVAGIMRRRAGNGRPALLPSRVARATLGPDQVWCTVCHMSVRKTLFADHLQTFSHRLAQSKLSKLNRLTLQLWEEHRGAPLDETPATAEADDRTLQAFYDGHRLDRYGKNSRK